MPTTPHLVLLTEADATVGLGHAVRCAGLLRALPVAHALSVVGGGSVLRRLFPAARHLGPADWTGFDWQHLGLDPVDLVLADIPYHRPRDWRKLRHPAAPLIAIDDHGGDVPADVVVNGTVLPAYHRYAADPAPGRVCAGPDYALVRPEFAATPWRACAEDPVAIVAGSGAEARDWVLGLARDLPALLPDRRLQIVVGPAFDALPTLTDRAAQHGIALQVGLAAPALATCLAESAVALITAGMVLYEAVAAGVPTVAFPQIADLVPEAAWFAGRGACLDLGRNGGAPATAAAAIDRLLADRKAAQRMSACQRRLLDGHGMARVAELLATHLRR